MDVDPHGQAYNIRFNRARRAERDLSEFLGLAKGVLADGTVTSVEADLVRGWTTAHRDAVEQWPLNLLSQRLSRIYADGRVDDEERGELTEMLASIVGGTAGVVLGEDASTDLPVDPPPHNFAWAGAVVVFTGKFALGTRAACERLAVRLGATCDSSLTKRTDYLIIGTFGSRDWVHTSFGRKIQKAVDLRASGSRPLIIAEEHWAAAITPAS
jgi:NAD-dependent DNA ligase